MSTCSACNELVGQPSQSWPFALGRAGLSHRKGVFYRSTDLETLASIIRASVPSGSSRATVENCSAVGRVDACPRHEHFTIHDPVDRAGGTPRRRGLFNRSCTLSWRIRVVHGTQFCGQAMSWHGKVSVMTLTSAVGGGLVAAIGPSIEAFEASTGMDKVCSDQPPSTLPRQFHHSTAVPTTADAAGGCDHAQ